LNSTRSADRRIRLPSTGAELYGYVGLGALGAFDYRLFAGTIYLQLTDTPGSPYQVQRFSIPYVAGGRGFWEPPVDGLRVGASAEALKLETTLRAADGSTLAADLSAILWVVSAEYAVHDLLVAAEYSRWHTNTTSSNVQVVPENVSTSERGYVMGNYRFTPWFVPGLYYSLMFPHVSQRSGGPEFVQHDLAATLRFDVNAYWLVKLEGHYMHGTAGLTPALNGNVPRSMLESDWGLFLVKTTAYF